MTRHEFSFQSELEYQIIEKAAREKIAELIDIASGAYLKAGYSMNSYQQNQYFMFVLFQSVNDLDPLSPERMGGLQLIIRFIQRLIEHYNTMSQNGGDEHV